MRPRFANRGSVHSSPGRNRASFASMRPRFANRGSSDGTISVRIDSVEASMRPRFANRGSVDRFRAAVLLCVLASMRPRFANRGSTAWQALIHPSHAASMRPRFANRGSPVLTMAAFIDLNRFNEAPIRESGKSPGRTISGRGFAGFNEAPIRESGKCHGIDCIMNYHTLQ